MSNDNLLLTGVNVEKLFDDVVQRPFMRADDDPTVSIDVFDPDTIFVEGVVHSAYFNQTKLESHRHEVAAWIRQLPSQFHRNGGGGWTFLNLCENASGQMWTSFHLTMERLYMLAAGLGLAHFALPRDVWAVLPGEMPYIIFTVTDD